MTTVEGGNAVEGKGGQFDDGGIGRSAAPSGAGKAKVPVGKDKSTAGIERLHRKDSVHADGRAARRIVETARRDVAALCGADPEHVVFTSGATEAANMALTPHYRMGRSPLRVSHLHVLASDHPCLLGGGQFAPERTTVIPVTPDGLADMAALARALENHDMETGLPMVAVHAANNETGVIQPLAEIAALVADAGGILVVDAVQAAGRMPIAISAGYGDFLVLSAHKIGGPRGAGALGWR